MHCKKGMSPQTAGLSRKRWNILATICFLLLVETSVAARLFLRQVTGENWALSSIAFSFVLVFFLHQPLERWIWGTETGQDVDRQTAGRE